MGLILWLLASIGAFVGATMVGTLSKLLADEFKAKASPITALLLRRAVARLPEDKRDRYREEWQSHIEETSGDISKLLAAFGFILAARKAANHPFRRYWDDFLEAEERRSVDSIAGRTIDFIKELNPEKDIEDQIKEFRKSIADGSDAREFFVQRLRDIFDSLLKLRVVRTLPLRRLIHRTALFRKPASRRFRAMQVFHDIELPPP